ncbi:DUF2844 domain-containing protein [Paraburkholderia dilworthii]|uniref:DUF2844 domain-containing protein n=1 Tax=Paraburkholderia dilworthii TaxID=948106 RepID=UPI0004876991|nr:DUF2844 domain-containing protein [Paraburkholderia dilworthii]
MRRIKIAMLTASLVLVPLSAYAALGGAPVRAASAPLVLWAATSQSALAPASSQRASGPISAAPYSVRQSVDANGVTIREYVLPSNVVFAVAWQGPVRPDMNTLLGNYFQRAASAGAGHPRGTGPLIDRSGDFQIESVGRPGNFLGKALLPRLLPAHVRAEDIQ